MTDDFNPYAAPRASLAVEEARSLDFEIAPAWRRLVAFGVDFLILFVLTRGLSPALEWLFLGPARPFFAALVRTLGSQAGVLFVAILLSAILAAWLGYFTLADASRSGATLGKRLLKIRVVDASGKRIGRRRALVRTTIKLVTNMFYGIGGLCTFLGNRRRALHDRAADTLVVWADGYPRTRTASGPSVEHPSNTR